MTIPPLNQHGNRTPQQEVVRCVDCGSKGEWAGTAQVFVYHNGRPRCQDCDENRIKRECAALSEAWEGGSQ